MNIGSSHACLVNSTGTGNLFQETSIEASPGNLERISVSVADATTPEAAIAQAIREAYKDAVQLRSTATTVASSSAKQVKGYEQMSKGVPFWKRNLHNSFSNAIDSARFKVLGADARARKAEQKLAILRFIATLPQEEQETYRTTFETLNSEAEETRGAARKLEEHSTTPFPWHYEEARPSDEDVDKARFTALRAEHALKKFTKDIESKSRSAVIDRSEASSPLRQAMREAQRNRFIAQAREKQWVERPLFSSWNKGLGNLRDAASRNAFEAEKIFEQEMKKALSESTKIF